MQQIMMITILAALCLVNWMAADTYATEKMTSEKREISTPTEHYWVVTIDDREQKDGVYTRVLDNGQKIEQGSYILGLKDGQWQYWSKQGQKTKEENYAKGKKHGTWAQWYSNGQKESEGSYEMDIPVRTHRQWHMDGSVRSETVYQKKGGDVTALKKTWHPDGKQVVQSMICSVFLLSLIHHILCMGYLDLKPVLAGTYFTGWDAGTIRLMSTDILYLVLLK